jgi:5'-methylthioadenosine phosphorylase
MAKKIVGIIGGSGLYEIEGLKNIRRKKLKTPFGNPSDEYVIGDMEGTMLVFLPRHARGHLIPPSQINYRANIFGMKLLGVQYLVSISAVGSMKEEISPGDIVIVDQFFDQTKGIRKHTFFESGMVSHISFGDPVCPQWSHSVYEAAQKVSQEVPQKISRSVHKGGTYICIEGPQFSTRAESKIYRSWGVDVIGMTNIPEAKLAREAELCYAAVAFSTDYDSWREGEDAVTADVVLATLKKNVDTAKKIVQKLPEVIPSATHCSCGSALKYALVTERVKISKKVKDRLKPLI